MKADTVSVQALAMLRRMSQIGKLAQAGDPSVQKYLDNGAARIVDGEVLFHRERFLLLYADEVLDSKEGSIIP